MKSFLLRIFLFVLLLSLIVIVGIVLPVTPRASKYYLYAKIQKDSLLKNTQSPRIIFVGGSNASFGLNSQIIKDSLLLNPINTGVNAGIGLEYMIDNTLQYIKKGDIVILAPEYDHFYGCFMYGNEVLLQTVADVNPMQIIDLETNQKKNIFKSLLHYSLSKFKTSEYFNFNKEFNAYGIDSFNEYGDNYIHWTLKQQKFKSYPKISAPFNIEAIEKIKEFNTAIKEKEARLYLTYPPYQDTAFDNSIYQIRKVEKELRKTDLTIIGSALRYKMPDSLMFDSSYHLTKAGADYRTQLFLEDFKKAQANRIFH
jgi:hypothetical protein